ncbi:MAG: hypothetical protein LVR00_04130 [Rhabdochlamydiaceae bacterium]|jgi:hypothetical protein
MDKLTILRKHLREAQQIRGASLCNKAEIKQIEQDVFQIELEIAQMDPRIYIAILPEQKSGKSCREALARQVENLADLSRQIAETTDPDLSRSIQNEYLSKQEHYCDLLEMYRTTSATNLRAVVFETSHAGHVLPRDLAGAAFLAPKGLDNPLPWIQELAKHPFTQPLDPRTFDLVQDAAHTSFLKEDELTLYLHLILCQNAFLRLQETAKTLSSGQDSKLQEAQEKYDKLQQLCKKIATSLRREVPSEIRALLCVHCPDVIIQNTPQQREVDPFPKIAESELLALSRQSLLERLALSPLIASRPKDPASDISDDQRRLIKSFKGHSRDQVDGFYLEEFGFFSPTALEREFSVDSEGNGLFGLNQKDIATIFESMKSKGWIQQRSAQDYLFSVAHPLTLAQKGDLLALIADFPLSQENREKVANRLHKFLFLAAQSSFTFSWKDPAAIIASNEALEKEREVHEQKMLDAKFFLEERLHAANISLTEFKRRVFLQDHRSPPSKADFTAARNALLRYLLHKTELQHLDNVAKAPLQGERNQIELLSTARQYPIDSLLCGATKEEQTMQLAFLLFEEDYGARCNAMQIQLFRSLMLDTENPEALAAIQARMGFGKTALLPLLALIKIAKEAHKPPKEKSLIRYVVPKAVLQDNAVSFDRRIGGILGSNVIKDREFFALPN